MAKLKYLMLHCAATPEGRDIKAETVVKWHTDPKPRGRGWSKAGYSQIIELNGALKTIHDFDSDSWIDSNELTNGARGMNSEARHICYIGGLDRAGLNPKDTRTEEQLAALETVVKYTVLLHPDILVCGHNQFAAKACPSFNVPRWLREIGLPETNIFTESLI